MPDLYNCETEENRKAEEAYDLIDKALACDALPYPAADLVCLINFIFRD